MDVGNIWFTGDADSFSVVVSDYVELTNTYEPRDIALTATVTACWLRNGTKIAPATVWTCSSATSGADWPNGIVAVPIATGDTSALLSTPNDVLIEIKIVDGTNVRRYRSQLDEAIRIQKSVT